MEEEERMTLDELLKSGRQHFTKLKRDEHNGKMFTAEIQVFGYAELLYLISDLIKAVKAVWEMEEDGCNRGPMVIPKADVSTILELALQLFPFHEAEFLDEINDEIKKRIMSEDEDGQ